VPTVKSHAARLAPREFYSVIRSKLSCSRLAAEIRWHSLTWLENAQGRKIMTRGLALLSEAFGQRLGRLTWTQQFEFKSLLKKLR
jgi:hypothetical protein